MKKIKRIFKVKYPLVKQYDQKDCGPAALLSILKYYNGNSNLPYLRELCNTNLQGSTMLDLVNAATTLGFKAFGASGKYKDLMKENMPCIAHVVINETLNHSGVVYKIKINSKILRAEAYNSDMEIIDVELLIDNVLTTNYNISESAILYQNYPNPFTGHCN